MRIGRLSCSHALVLGVLIVVGLSSWAGALRAAEEEVGIFEAQADVGTVTPPGTAAFDKATQQYRIASSGQNIWGMHDDFHFLYRKASGDLTLTAEVTLVGAGKNAHRKGGWMIRQGLEPDAPYVDVMVHGDGHIGLQYRTKQGATTADTKATIKSPATVRLERRGNTFTLYVAPKAEQSDKPQAFEKAGSIECELKDPVFVGLAVSAHDPMTTETAVFAGVSLKNEAAPAEKSTQK